MRVRIACIHQGYELYGSDRSFIESVAALRAGYPEAEIEVVLPRHGPIVARLAALADRVVFEPLWVLRRRDLAQLATIGLARLGPALARAARRLRGFDLVYINTSVIVDYALAARAFPGKALIHVHEIPEGAARHVLGALVRRSGAEIVFNSKATRDAMGVPSGRVVYNGVAGPAAAEPRTYDGRRPLRVLMLGRVNRIKGQEVLLDALAGLPEAVQRRVAVRMVGGAFENPEQERALRDRVAAAHLATPVEVEPFAADPSGLYRWADVVAVPSRRPESLGRVAIEAMAFGRPCLASAIGGLVEVVEDGVTGWLVPPGDAAALAARLRAVVEAPDAWDGFPAAARARYDALFSDVVVARAIAAVAGSVLDRRGRARGAGLASGGTPEAA